MNENQIVSKSMPTPSSKVEVKNEETLARAKDDFFSVATASVKGKMMIDGYIAIN